MLWSSLLKHTAKGTDFPPPEEEEAKPEKPITFYVSTWGGDALGMFGIYDLMRTVREECPIETFGLGKVMSAGVLFWQQEQKVSVRLVNTAEL